MLIITSVCGRFAQAQAVQVSGKASDKAAAHGKPRIADAYGRLPISFEPNRGQTDKAVKFLARGSGYTVFLASSEAVLAFRNSSTAGKKSDCQGAAFPDCVTRTRQSRRAEATTVRMKLAGAQAATEISGFDELPGKSNYFVGNDPAKWRRNIATYAQVRYQNIYPGIDLIYHGGQGQLEYDFAVAPGFDPGAIRLTFPGADRLKVNAQGELVLNAQGKELRFRKPVIYQQAAVTRGTVPSSPRQLVDGRYVIHALKRAKPDSQTSVAETKMEVSFEIARYDASRPLVIDPVLAYSTYLGGSTDDVGRSIAVDSAGNAYVTGSTRSTDFPTANPLQPQKGSDDGDLANAFVSKLSPDGSTLIYSTYLGGSSNDRGYGIAVDSAGNAYVTGDTRSLDFPTANALQPELDSYVGNAFVAKLDPTGSSLIYSTYLGGSGVDAGYGIAADSAGNAYVTGSTASTDFPTANPLQPTYHGGGSDAFVAKFDPTGSTLLYSTYLGGSGQDLGNGIAVDGRWQCVRDGNYLFH